MEAIAMENKELKEKIRKNLKEEIAISNMRKEFAMKTKKNRKIIYTMASACAVFMLCLGIMVGSNKLNTNPFQNNSHTIAQKENKEEKLKIELNINEIKEMVVASLDADIKTITIENLPKKFEFVEAINIPEGYTLENRYFVYTKKDVNAKEYNVLHDYVFHYKKDNTNNITIAFSEIEKPIRDYYIDGADKISKIGGVEIRISKYQEMYIVTFEYNKIYFDIETMGISENQLVDLLGAIINNFGNNIKQEIEDQDINTKEPANEKISSMYPDYYAGKYIDDKGNNVVLLCDDTTTNRKEICRLLNITESKTIFKTAKYSYQYLTQLQNEISKLMQNKELTSVTGSAIMEEYNKIEVTLINNNKENINKLKELDTIGGAIQIQYNSSIPMKEDYLRTTGI